MPSIYEITYLPWENNTEGRPWKYSGSDYYDNLEYFGSASSTTLNEWAQGKTVSEWWKHETKNNPHHFKKHIIVQCSNEISRIELQALESAIQKAEDHRNDNRYFNRTNKHFNSPIVKNALKGMSYKEIYGEERSREIREKRSLSQISVRKNKKWDSNKNGKLTGLYKGKTYEELYGEEKAKEVKSMRSAQMLGRIVSDETKIKSSNIMKNRPRVECEFCKKYYDELNYKRWHGPKCKEKIHENF